MSSQWGSLPDDLLAEVFDYLDARACFSVRGTNRTWYASAIAGCTHLHFSFPKLNKQVGASSSTFLHYARFVGHHVQRATTLDALVNGAEGSEWQLKRTRGQLPKPEVGGTGAQTAEVPLHMKAHLSLAWVRLESAFAGRNLISLDLTASIYQSATTMSAGPTRVDGVSIPGHLFDRINGDPKDMQRVLESVDLSGLRWLQSLSVKRCSALRELLLPPSLTALDASNSRLEIATFRGGAGSLSVLNLDGCRNFTPSVACFNNCKFDRHGLLANLQLCREIDLSWCQHLPSSTIAAGLQTADSLVSIAMRGVATDEILLALAASSAAKVGQLRLVDCAHSKQISDGGVEELLSAAPSLERLNLRATGVSKDCYYKTPVTLEARARNADDDIDNDGDDSRVRKLQKGDRVS
jgi:hypothetical protein